MKSILTKIYLVAVLAGLFAYASIALLPAAPAFGGAAGSQGPDGPDTKSGGLNDPNKGNSPDDGSAADTPAQRQLRDAWFKAEGKALNNPTPENKAAAAAAEKAYLDSKKPSTGNKSGGKSSNKSGGKNQNCGKC